MHTTLGICQWFHFNDHDGVERVVSQLHDLGVRHLRTGISWADFHRPGGMKWVDWQFEQLRDFDLLVSIWHTPPSISEGGTCSSPPRRLRDYADFLDLVIGRYGHRIEAIELWNEPNNAFKWDFPNFDPDWNKFAEMIVDAASWCSRRGMYTVLGGMIPVDPHWLRHLQSRGALDHVDAVAIHGFPGMWWDHHPNWEWFRDWQGWDEKIAAVQNIVDKPIWITETGFATWNHIKGSATDYDIQSHYLREAVEAPAHRTYWYSCEDLDPSRAAIEGFHIDEHEYHLGLSRFNGPPKPAWYTFKNLLNGTRFRHRDANVSGEPPLDRNAMPLKK